MPSSFWNRHCWLAEHASTGPSVLLAEEWDVLTLSFECSGFGKVLIITIHEISIDSLPGIQNLKCGKEPISSVTQWYFPFHDILNDNN